MLHADPDFARLPISTRQLLAQAMLSPLEDGAHATPLQRQLIRALAHSILGVELDTTEFSHVPPEQVKAALAGEPEPVRHRYAQFLLMLELVAHPLPPAMADAVERYVDALGIQEGLLVLARDYAEQAYGLALTDIARKGYFQDFSNHEKDRKSVV